MTPVEAIMSHEIELNRSGGALFLKTHYTLISSLLLSEDFPSCSPVNSATHLRLFPEAWRKLSSHWIRPLGMPKIFKSLQFISIDIYASLWNWRTMVERERSRTCSKTFSVSTASTNLITAAISKFKEKYCLSTPPPLWKLFQESPSCKKKGVFFKILFSKRNAVDFPRVFKEVTKFGGNSMR